MDQGAWRLEGIRVCISHRLDRRDKQFSIFFHLNQAVSTNRKPGLRLQNTRRLTGSATIEKVTEESGSMEETKGSQKEKAG